MFVIHSYIVKKYAIVTQTYFSPPPRSLVMDGSAVPTTVDSSAARSPETVSASMISQNRRPRGLIEADSSVLLVLVEDSFNIVGDMMIITGRGFVCRAKKRESIKQNLILCHKE